MTTKNCFIYNTTSFPSRTIYTEIIKNTFPPITLLDEIYPVLSNLSYYV